MDDNFRKALKLCTNYKTLLFISFAFLLEARFLSCVIDYLFLITFIM